MGDNDDGSLLILISSSLFAVAIASLFPKLNFPQRFQPFFPFFYHDLDTMILSGFLILLHDYISGLGSHFVPKTANKALFMTMF